MILILSRENDYSTSKVMKWLLHFQQDFLRINANESIELSSLALGDEPSCFLLVGGVKQSIPKIKSYWYRRGMIEVKSRKKPNLPDNELGRYLNQVQTDELRIVTDYLYHLLDDKKSLGSFAQKGMNKIQALNKALKCGLKIPETLVTGSKKELESFLDTHEQVIVKPIFEISVFNNEACELISYTSLFAAQVLHQLDDHFFPSLFQKCIDKKYELRVFYIDGVCYANAIFSQLNKETSIDSRKYIDRQTNRRVPYHLPECLIEKIKRLMNEINLNCGSIDLIVNKAKEYIFLEVNPIGQFGMTSYIGNFRLEKKIAKYLSDA